MSDSLFGDIPTSLSPRLAWMQEYRIQVSQAADQDGFDGGYVARALDPEVDDYEDGHGPNEVEACLDFAEKNNLPHWLSLT